MGEPRAVFTPVSQDTINLKSPVVEIKAKEHKKEMGDEDHDHYSGSVPSATDEADSKRNSDNESSEDESEDPDKTFKTITEAPEGEEESMIIGDKSMVALTSIKSKNSSS